MWGRNMFIVKCNGPPAQCPTQIESIIAILYEHVWFSKNIIWKIEIA